MSSLKSGEEYTLSQLFSGDRKIIIPDLQRDYCWGDKKHGSESTKVELVSGFVSNLIKGFQDNKDERLMLGLIYGYENPVNYVHLCDGQQRITTLFLLLGMLCRRNGCDPEKNHLISKFEYVEDDKEPYLQYSIRESTLYFLSDLVCHFFINKDECADVSDIRKSHWYFNSYAQDSSIQSMISALSIIEKKLKGKTDFIEFQTYVENKIFMLYFDLETRENGEDLFVIINTTGEPLTATENLKPILLGALEGDTELNKQWEEREEFFWKNKKKGEHQADEGHFDFITWHIKVKVKANEVRVFEYFKTKIEQGKDSLRKELVDLHKYFVHYTKLLTFWEDKSFINVLSPIKELKETSQAIYSRDFTKDSESSMQQQNILLPLLYFSMEISDDRVDVYQFLRRLRKNYFDKELSKRDGKYLDWRYILQIVSLKSSLEDILHYKPIENEKLKSIANVKDNSADWYNAEEIIKEQFKVDKAQKEKIELWEDHLDFLGDIGVILKVHVIDNSVTKIPLLIEYVNNSRIFNFQELDRYYKNYDILEKCMSEDGGEKSPSLANYYRLFKVIFNCNKIEKIYRTSGIEGVQFSTKNRNHLDLIQCYHLYKSKDTLGYMKSNILKYSIEKHLFDITETTFTASKLIKAWLTLKVFNAEKDKVLLAYWDGNDTGVSAYLEFNRNFIFSSQPGELANCICGFAVKSGGARGNYIDYTYKDLWLEKDIIDTPFAGMSFAQFSKRNKMQLAAAEKIIKVNKSFIDQLVKVNKLKIVTDAVN